MMNLPPIKADDWLFELENPATTGFPLTEILKQSLFYPDPRGTAPLPGKETVPLPPAPAPAAPAAINPAEWGSGSYSPTPTIIEAARSHSARHTVHDITRSDAGAVNLAATSGCIERIIAAAKAGRRKAIVTITGVPGAGKTLVGLNVATRHGERSNAAHAVFLLGNGPLVAAMREALARDALDCARRTDPKARIGTSRNAVRAFIQNVHHFRDDTLRNPAPPNYHLEPHKGVRSSFWITTLRRRRPGPCRLRRPKKDYSYFFGCQM